MSFIFQTKVSGIPCQCKVDYTPPDIRGFEFRILDRKGYLAPWLERKVTPDTIDALYDAYIEEVADYATGQG